MKSILIGLLLFFSCGVLFAQDANLSSVKINQQKFILGENLYSIDYDLIFNKWYHGYTSSQQIKRGESIDWVNKFTGNYSIEFNDYDVSINNEIVGINYQGISFNSNESKILLIYDENEILRYIRFWNNQDAEIPLIETVKSYDGTHTSNNIYLVNNILWEKAFSLYGVIEIKISLVPDNIFAKTKTAYDWVVTYEQNTEQNIDNDRMFLGLCYQLSIERIRIEQAEKERTLQLEQEALEKQQTDQQELILQQQKDQLAQQQLEIEQQEKEKIANWRKSINGISDVNQFIVYDGRVDQVIIKGKTTRLEALSILKSAFITKNSKFIIKSNNYTGTEEIWYGDYSGALIYIYYNNDIVDRIVPFITPIGSPARNDFEKYLYGVLTIVQSNIIRFW